MYLLWSLLPWVLPAIALTSLLYHAWRISRSGRLPLLSEILSISELSPPLRIAPKPAERQKRPTKWISFEEFKVLLDKNPRDFIVIDLRSDAPWSPFPVAGVFVPAVTLNELMETLEWLPSDRSAVFYDISDLGISRIQTSASMEGSVPFYFLDGGLSHLEAA